MNKWLNKKNLHPVVNNWVNTILRNGGSKPSLQTIVASNELYNNISNLLPKIKALNGFVSDNLIASITPLISNYGNAVWTNTNFVAGDLTSAGLKGNASNKYLKTGVIPATCFASVATCGVTVYISVGSIGAYKTIGCNTNGTYEPAVLLYPSYANNMYWDGYYGTGGVGRLTAAQTIWTGYMSANRTATNANAVYKANSSIAHTTLVSGTNNLTGAARPNLEMYVFSGNQSGASNAPTDQRLSFAAIHDGLTITESLQFYNAIQLFRQRLNGGFI